MSELLTGVYAWIRAGSNVVFVREAAASKEGDKSQAKNDHATRLRATEPWPQPMATICVLAVVYGSSSGVGVRT